MVSTNEMAIEVQAPEGVAKLPSKTVPSYSSDSRMDTPLDETTQIKSSEPTITISESVNKIEPQMEKISLVETKEQTKQSGQSDELPVISEEVLSSVEIDEHAENSQMETSEQTQNVSVNINEQSENLPMDTADQVENSKMDTMEQASNSKMDTTEQAENAPAEITKHEEESSLEERHSLQSKDDSKVGDVLAEQEEVEESKLTDGSVAQLPSIEDTEAASLTGSDKVENTTEPVLENEPQLAPTKESTQGCGVTQSNLNTITHSKSQSKDDLKVCEPVLPKPSSDQKKSGKATTRQGALPVVDMTVDFPPVTQEILKALEAAVHQCRLQSSKKRAEDEANAEKDSAEKDVSQSDRKVTKTDKQKTQVEKGNKPQTTTQRTTRSQHRKTESPEREPSSRQRVKSTPKDGSPTTSNEGSSSSSTASRKTRSESSTVLKRSREREEDGYKVRMTKLFCQSVSFNKKSKLQPATLKIVCFCIDS